MRTCKFVTAISKHCRIVHNSNSWGYWTFFLFQIDFFKFILSADFNIYFSTILSQIGYYQRLKIEILRNCIYLIKIVWVNRLSAFSLSFHNQSPFNSNNQSSTVQNSRLFHTSILSDENRLAAVSHCLHFEFFVESVHFIFCSNLMFASDLRVALSQMRVSISVITSRIN